MSTAYSSQLSGAQATIRAKGTTWTLRRRVQTTHPKTGVSTLVSTNEQTVAAVQLPVSGAMQAALRIEAREKLMVAGGLEWDPQPGDEAERSGVVYRIEQAVPLQPDGTPLVWDLYLLR